MSKADTTLTIEQIVNALAHSAYFNCRRNVVVPNVSWGLLMYEADFVSMTKAGILTEIEIKRSWQDFRKDFEKKHQHDDPRVSYFYYCVPKSIAEKVMDALYVMEPGANGKTLITGIKEGVPINAGLIVYECYDCFGRECVSITFRTTAGRRKAARKLFETEQFKLAHLGCMRIWDLYDKVSKLQQYDLFNQKKA